MNKLHVPFYGYDLILDTIRTEIYERNLDLRQQEYTRKSFLKEIQSRFSCPEPCIVKVHLDNRWNDRENAGVINQRDTVDVLTFDFSHQLIDLLNDDSLFGNLDNLVVNRSSENPNSKWLPYERKDPNAVFEVLDGNWYQKYARTLVQDPDSEFCVPIGLYIDASETVVYQRYSFQPLIMFPLLLNCKARNRITSSRVIALIPNLDAKSSAVKNATRMGGREYKGTSIRNYHQCMEAALQSLKDCQKRGGLKTFLRLGNDVSERVLKVPVAFILGDAKSQDHLAGRYGGHNTKRMCRACNVRFDNSDRASFKCKWIQFDRFHQKSMVALNVQDNALDRDTKREIKEAYSYLQKHSQHALLNAFHDIDFAGFPRGIFGCTPHDLMHIFLEGVLKYSTRIFINGFLEKDKAAIDKLVERILGSLRSSERKNMPRTCFIKGMTNLTMITADEEVGMALTLLILAQTDNGQAIFDARMSNNIEGQIVLDHEATNDNDDTSTTESNDSADDQSTSVSSMDSSYASVQTVDEAGPNHCTHESFVQLMECLLSFWSWYKSKESIAWNNTSKEKLLFSIRKMIRLVRFVLPREQGNNWKIQKLHELLHIPEDVDNFGSPKNFDCGILENRLIHVGKHNSKFTQKRGPSVFTEQLAQRIHEQQCINKANRCLQVDLTEGDDDTSVASVVVTDNVTHVQKHRACYNIYRVGNNIMCHWLTKTRANVPEVLTNYIGSIMQEEQVDSLDVFTEIIHNNKTYRAHPNYRNGGPWYDWAVIKYEPSDADKERAKTDTDKNIFSAYPPGYYPAKLLGFFKLHDHLHCIIHCTETKTNSDNDSCLTERWTLEYESLSRGRRPPLYRYVEVASVEDRVFVVEENPGVCADLQDLSSSVVMVKHKHLWKIYFTETI
jgi:hypothetical protein